VVGHCEWTDKKGGSGGLVLHWRSTDGGWTRDEIDSRRCAYGDSSGPSIAFDSAGNVAVAFGLLDDDVDLFADVLQVAVRAFGSTTWELETPGVATKVGWAPDILYAPALGGFVLGWNNDNDYSQNPENRFCERRGEAAWWCESQDGDLGTQNDGSPWIAVDNGGRVFLATGGSRPGEPGVILIDRDPSTGQWNIEYVDYYQEYEWQGEFPVQDFHHLALTPSSLQGPPLIPDSPTLSWTWNARYGQPADYHLYFARKTP
jgi:hypothetical protein